MDGLEARAGVFDIIVFILSIGLSMKCKLFLSLAAWLVMYLAVTVSGCEAGGSAGTSGDGRSGDRIVIDPGGGLAIGYFQQQLFEITVLDAEGMPLSGVPVVASFIGPAHNGSLFPDQVETDGRGRGAVNFIAPDKEVDFQIRFQSPSVDDTVFIEITVDPSLVRIDVAVTYTGEREIAEVQAEIYEEKSCSDLGQGEVGTPVGTANAASLPATFSFPGLRDDRGYAVLVRGNSTSGETRALGCLDGLVPNEGTEQVTLNDLSLDVAGKYDMTTRIAAAGELDLAVEQFVRPFTNNFLAEPATAILDGVRKELMARSPFAAEPFDELRSGDDLDGALDTYFEEAGVDLSGSFAPVFGAVKDFLQVITAYGTLELSSGETNSFALYHRIDRLEFTSEQSDSMGVYVVAIPETGTGSAFLETASGDRLEIGEHDVSISLGGSIYFLFLQGLEMELGSADVASVLEGLVDCGSVAAFLAPYLSDVANQATVQTGCETTLADAEQWIVLSTADIGTRYNHLTFAGDCAIADPTRGLRVERLEQGELEVRWRGVSLNGPTALGPMSATFEAVLAE